MRCTCWTPYKLHSQEQSTTVIPPKIGKYLVESVLGSGAMGIVYQGFDPLIDRRVAIKTIHASLLRSVDADDFRVRFRREAQAAGRCFHPNIATVFDYGEEAGIPFIAMELVQGKELRQYIKSGHLFGLAQTISIVSQILAALGCAHANKVIHRDIKPSNIILQENGTVKVTDFGVAGLDICDLTIAGTIVGTPGYMAPEQTLGQKADSRSDLFSTAVLMFEMLTGQRPESGTGNQQLIPLILSRNPEFDPSLSECLETVLTRGLAQVPAMRFQNAEEFAASLDKLYQRETAPKISSQLPVQPLVDNASGLVRLDSRVIVKLEQEMILHIGPIARLIVRKAAERTDNPEDLVQQLSLSVPEIQRPDFIRKLVGLLPSKTNSLIEFRTTIASGDSDSSLKSTTDFQLPVLEQACKDLAQYLGPIAKLLVKQTSREAANVEDLYRRLAGHIENPSHRQAFLGRCPRQTGFSGL